jgi:hypothetical protein
MNEYYVEKGANGNGEHFVHKGSCASLPAKAALHFIGVRNGTEAPLKEAAYFWCNKSAPCPACMAG